MSGRNSVVLNNDQIAEIKKLASDTRKDFGVYTNVPIANDIRLILEKKDILLCEYPFSGSDDTHTYGNIVWFKAGEETITFIGLNTACYYDEQIFALAHEIYHYSTKSGKAYFQDIDEEDKETEKMADRFAAEFLLPAEALNEIVFSMFGKVDLEDVSEARILRFVARMHCDWWLPYQALVNRLYEEEHISESQYNYLYNEDCRSEEGTYRRILRSIDKELSVLLNTKTLTIGVSYSVVETIINNHDDGFIDDDEFIHLLALIGKRPEDYGIDIVADLDDELMEMKKEWG